MLSNEFNEKCVYVFVWVGGCVWYGHDRTEMIDGARDRCVCVCVSGNVFLIGTMNGQ